MSRWLLVALLASSLPACAQKAEAETVRQAIESHLGRPYVWGASGMKGFDCSGFVWRVATESGIYIKRTTARKLWFSTAPVKKGEGGGFGNLLFFDNLKHVGIVNDKRTFYHAQSSKGTILSEFNEYWRRLAVGEHRLFPTASK